MNNLEQIEKKCEKCGSDFICNHSAKCWCIEIELSSNLRAYLKKEYSDCLCKSCLEMYVEKDKNNLPFQ